MSKCMTPLCPRPPAPGSKHCGWHSEHQDPSLLPSYCGIEYLGKRGVGDDSVRVFTCNRTDCCKLAVALQ